MAQLRNMAQNVTKQPTIVLLDYCKFNGTVQYSLSVLSIHIASITIKWTHVQHDIIRVLLLLLHPLNGLFSRTTRVSLYQKGRTSLDLNDARE